MKLSFFEIKTAFSMKRGLFLHRITAFLRHLFEALLEGRWLLRRAFFILLYFPVYGILVDEVFEEILLTETEKIAEAIVIT
jgi:hypothetical protein